MDRPLPRASLRVGLPVAYLGADEEVLDWGRPPVVGVLRRGHPGRVQELNDGQHVVVSWSGLEEADVSQVVGFSPDADGSRYPGLAELDEAEHLRRVERSEAGGRP